MRKIAVFFSLLFLLSSCSRDQEPPPRDVLEIESSPIALTHCEDSNLCDASCFERAPDHCEGPWAYPAHRACYQRGEHAACGLNVDESVERDDCTRHDTVLGDKIERCEGNGSESTTERIVETIQVQVSLPADYMRYFYEADGQKIIAKMRSELVTLCGGEAVATEIAKIRDQCFPLASDIGTPDPPLTNFFESLELIFTIMKGVSACENSQDLDLVTMLAGVAERVGRLRANEREVMCVQRPEHMSTDLQRYMDYPLQCPQTSIDQMIDELFAIFYGKVKQKVERVIERQCSANSGAVYELILNTIQAHANPDLEQAITTDLERQCLSACHEMSFYWSCDEADKVCADGTLGRDCERGVRQCPADDAISERVIIEGTQCSVEIDEVRAVGQGRAWTSTCRASLALPQGYDATPITPRTCRTSGNGLEAEPVTCQGDDYEAHYTYSPAGVHRVEAARVLSSREREFDHGAMFCVTGDDMFDWSTHLEDPPQVNALYERLMSMTSTHAQVLEHDAQLQGLWRERMKQLGEFYGDELFQWQFLDEAKERAALDAFYTNLAWLHERYPGEGPSCMPSEEHVSSGNLCGHQGAQTSPVRLEGLAESRSGFVHREAALEEGMSVWVNGTDEYILTRLPFGMRGIDHLTSTTSFGVDPNTPLSFQISASPHISNTSNDATVSIVYDAYAQGLEQWFMAQGWRIESGLDVEVTHEHMTRDYRVASKDFRAGARVDVPSHRHDGDVNTRLPWRYFATIHHTHFGERVRMCERYLGGRAKESLNARRTHPISSLCMARLASAARSRADVSDACLDDLTRQALSLPVQLLEQDVTARNYVEVDPGATHILQQITLHTDDLSKRLVEASSWFSELQPAVERLQLEPIARAPGSGRNRVDDALLNHKLSAVIGTLHRGLGTHAPHVQERNDPLTLSALITRRYGLPDEDEHFVAALQRWREETHRAMLRAAHHTEGVSDEVFITVLSSVVAMLQARLDMSVSIHDMACALSKTCGYEFGVPSSGLHESSLSIMWEMHRTLFHTDAPLWDASSNASPLHPSHPLGLPEHRERKALYAEFNLPNAASLITPRERARRHIAQGLGESEALLGFEQESWLEAHQLVDLRDALRVARARRQNFQMRGVLGIQKTALEWKMDRETINQVYESFLSELGLVAQVFWNRVRGFGSDEFRRIMDIDSFPHHVPTLERELLELSNIYRYSHVTLKDWNRMYQNPSSQMGAYADLIHDMFDDPNASHPRDDFYVPLSNVRYSTEISVSDARFALLQPDPNLAVEAIHVPWEKSATQDRDFISARGGDLLTIDVSGKWAPDCALHMNHGLLTSVLGFEVYAKSSFPLVGSSGYIIDEKASAVDAETSRDSSSNFNDCVFPANHRFDLLNEPVMTAVKGCMGAMAYLGAMPEDGSIGPSHLYAKGYRVPEGVPFPDAPVGSLLLVRVSGASSAPTLVDVESIEVVHGPVSSFVVPEDSKYYLVINDQAHSWSGGRASDALWREIALDDGASETYSYPSCQGRGTPQDRLLVRTQLSRPAQGMMQRVAQNMIVTLQEFDALRERTGHSSSAFSDELDRLRERAMARLFRRPHMPATYAGEFEQVPVNVRTVFKIWLDAHVRAMRASMDMRIDMMRERELVLEILRVVEDRYDNADLVGRIHNTDFRVMLAHQILHRNSSDYLSLFTRNLFGHVLPAMQVHDDMAPALDLIDPQSLDMLLHNLLHPSISQIDAVMMSQLGAGSPFVDELLRVSDPLSEPPQVGWTALSFPRPDVRDQYEAHYRDFIEADASGDVDAKQRAQDAMDALGLSLDIPRVSDFRTDLFWKSLYSEDVREPLSLQILPQDLYKSAAHNPASSTYFMDCHGTGAVLRDTLILFNVDRELADRSTYREVTESLHRRTTAHTSPVMDFVSGDGLIPVRVQSRGSLSLFDDATTGFLSDAARLPLVVSEVESDLSHRKSGLGLSPFRRLELDKRDLLYQLFQVWRDQPEPIHCKQTTMAAHGGVLTPEMSRACESAPLYEGGARKDLRVVQEVIVLMQYEYRDAPSPITWLESCATSP